MHTGERPFIREYCPNTIFGDQYKLNQHGKTHIKEIIQNDNEKKLHDCHDCAVSFVTDDELTRHRLNHSVLKPVHCKFCSFVYNIKTQQDLQTAVKVHRRERHYGLD